MEAQNARQDTASPGLLESIWRYRLLVIAFTILGGVAGLLFALQQPPEYEATARLLLADPRNAGVFGEIRGTVEDTGRYIRNQAELIRTGSVFPQASEAVGGRYTPRELRERITVEGLNEVDLILITARDGTAQGAAELADAIADAYRTVVRDLVQSTAGAAIAELRETNDALRQEIRQINTSGFDEAAADAERTAALAQIAENESRIAQLSVDAALFRDGVESFAPAEVPLEPSRPRPIRTTAAGLLLAFAVASAYAWWRHGVTRTLEQGSDPAVILRAPLLGEIPSFGRVGVTGDLPTVDAPFSPAAEAYQFVIAALASLLDDVEGSTILVTSATPGDGKTTTALNLAIAARAADRRVMLVDADRRMLGLTKRCGVEPQAGLTNLHSEAVPVKWASTWVDFTEDLRLPLVSTGYELDDPVGYFRTAAFRRSMERLRENSDIVFIDSPPLLAVSETSAIAGQADGIVLVVSRGTSQRVLQDVRRRLEFVGTPLLGYVFNRARSSAFEYTGKYGYGENGYTEGKPKRRGRRRREKVVAQGASWSAPGSSTTGSSTASAR